jgi:glycerophosphoryl diester phosphodiesterase
MPTAAGRRTIELIAHRGAKLERPENTLPAFRRALELGADGIELDVHATRDGVVVVHHDDVPRVQAPAAGGALRPIAQLSAEQLERLEVAPGVGIPTLRSVFQLVGTRAAVYVEIKGRAIERAVVDCVRAAVAEFGARAAVHSFDHAAVARVHALAPELATGLLFDSYPARPGAAIRDAGARDCWPRWDLVDQALVGGARAGGARVVAWTVNSARAARALVELGIDAICTDDVPAMRDALTAA